MNKLSHGLERFIKALQILIGLIMLASLLLVFANVVFRALFNSSIFWGESLTIYLIIGMVFIGTGVVFWDSEHLVMEFLYEKVSEAWKARLDDLSAIFTFLTSVLLMVLGLKVTRDLYSLGQLSPDGSIPLWIVMFSIPFGAFVTVLAQAGRAFKRKT